ncbi:MAG: hypothetical protein ACLQB4_07775 [Beijerinckiaceae bacterium]
MSSKIGKDPASAHRSSRHENGVAGFLFPQVGKPQPFGDQLLFSHRNECLRWRIGNHPVADAIRKVELCSAPRRLVDLFSIGVVLCERESAKASDWNPASEDPAHLFDGLQLAIPNTIVPRMSNVFDQRISNIVDQKANLQ